MARPTKREQTNKKIAEAVSKMSEEVLHKLDEVFAIDGTVEEACYYADISCSAYYVWVKENPELKERFDRLRNRPVLKARQTVVKSLDNPHDAQWYLTRKRKMEFGDNVDITSGGDKLESVVNREKVAEFTKQVSEKLLDDQIKRRKS